MKEYYQQRFHWIFRYTSKNFWYCIAKTLCIVVGLPIYSVMFLVEMALTLVNMLFCWIPVLNVVVTVVCKALMSLVGWTFYICILPDIKQYRQATAEEIQYDVSDADADASEEQNTEEVVDETNK
ncbi:MAG TPA: hypothetical protein IAC95_04130 [Candidatus Fimimonas gallinarum]|uniref:Uncharacterized protein n=1 Tax=Candidatus Fimimonas gallinarum TaxID=2840821 RepID=A0A9D1E4L7_9BACT|nr:hypothetical protein [Candidatus Fimimonas gallinarum]